MKWWSYEFRSSVRMGVPVVGTHAIDWLPRRWQADSDDAGDIARVAEYLIKSPHVVRTVAAPSTATRRLRSIVGATSRAPLNPACSPPEPSRVRDFPLTFCYSGMSTTHSIVRDSEIVRPSASVAVTTIVAIVVRSGRAKVPMDVN